MPNSILIAEEKNEAAMLLKEALQNQDLHVVTASSISLGLFLARKNKPRVIFCGQILTDGSGQDLINEIRGDSDLHKIPCYLLTAQVDNQMLLEILKQEKLI